MVEGTWVEGKMEGQGKYTTKDGKEFVGEFVLGEKHGYGVRSYSDGSSYEGMWAKGKKHGQGKMMSANGGILEGEWKEGSLFDANGVILYPLPSDDAVAEDVHKGVSGTK